MIMLDGMRVKQHVFTDSLCLLMHKLIGVGSTCMQSPSSLKTTLKVLQR